MIPEHQTPLTLEALEEMLGKRSNSDQMLKRLDELASRFDGFGKQLDSISQRLVIAEETNKRHEKAIEGYTVEIKGLREEISGLKLSSAVDRVKLGTLVAGVTLVISGVISYLIGVVFKPTKP